MRTSELMNSLGVVAGEWNAPALRPVARWVTVGEASGRPRLVMQWEVPDVDALLRSSDAGAA